MPRRLMLKPSLKSVLLLIAVLLASASLVSLQTAQAGSTNAPYSPNGLVINEIFESSTGTEEYFELLNTSNVAITLTNYRVYNRDSFVSLSSLSNPSIAAGEYRHINAQLLGGSWFAGSGGITSTDFLGLVINSPTDSVIDVVNFGNTPNPSWPNYEAFRTYFFTFNIPQLPTSASRSLQRWPDGNDTDQGTDFASITSSPDAPSCGDPYEDTDNNPNTPTSQANGTTVLHRLCPGSDQDWIALGLNTSSTYTLRASAQGPSVDTVLRLYDSSGNLIAEDNNPNVRDSVIVFRPTTSGTFRVQVTSANGQGNNGPNYLYTFSVNSTLVPTSTATVQTTPTSSTVTPTPIPCQDIYEPDDSLNSARTLELNTTVQRHSLCPVGDQDWLTFTAGGNKVYSMFTGDLTGPTDTVITLYDAQGRFLAENDDYQPGQGLASRIDYTFTGNATYYLRVRDRRGSGGTGYEYSVGLTSQGGLPPTSTATASPTFNPNSPTPTTGPCGDAYETDGVPSTAKDILIGTTQRHSICPVSDADFVKFYGRTGKVYTVRTANLGPGLDTFMYLFDSNGTTVLAQNDDGGDGVTSRIDFYPLRDDFYYVQVKNAGDLGGSLMTYDLSLAVAPGVPQPPGTATAGPPPPGGSTPTTVVQPTSPPVPSPTAGGIPPTPVSVAPTVAPPLPPPVSTSQPPGGFPPPVPTNQIPPQLPPAPTLPVDETAIPGATAGMPNVPRTGHPPDLGKVPVKPLVIEPAKPLVPDSTLASLPVAFRFFYDHNSNSLFDKGEGIRGVDIFFVKRNGDSPSVGRITTAGDGYGTSSLLQGDYRVVIPYFGLDMPLRDFPGRDAHKIWLPSVTLPDRVP
jgi:hypothetical protein